MKRNALIGDEIEPGYNAWEYYGSVPSDLYNERLFRSSFMHYSEGTIESSHIYHIGIVIFYRKGLHENRFDERKERAYFYNWVLRNLVKYTGRKVKYDLFEDKLTIIQRRSSKKEMDLDNALLTKIAITEFFLKHVKDCYILTDTQNGNKGLDVYEYFTCPILDRNYLATEKELDEYNEAWSHDHEGGELSPDLAEKISKFWKEYPVYDQDAVQGLLHMRKWSRGLNIDTRILNATIVFADVFANPCDRKAKKLKKRRHWTH